MCETQAAARAKARRLVAKLKGRGWKYEVWNTSEWHYCAVNGTLYVYVHEAMMGPKMYHTLLGNGDYPHAGEMFWSPSKMFDDPNDAVAYQVRLARKFLNKTTAAVRAAEAIQKKPQRDHDIYRT